MISEKSQGNTFNKQVVYRKVVYETTELAKEGKVHRHVVDMSEGRKSDA